MPSDTFADALAHLVEQVQPILEQLAAAVEQAAPETLTAEQKLQRAEAALWDIALAMQRQPNPTNYVVEAFERHGYDKMYYDAMFSIPLSLSRVHPRSTSLGS